MTIDALDNLLDGVNSTERVNEWEPFHLLRNPFPSRAQPVWDVFYNQEDARRAFNEDLRDFLLPRPDAHGGHNQTLLLAGGNRVGKTHFMQHHRRVLERVLPPRQVLLPMAIVSTEGADTQRFVEQAIAQWIDSVARQSGGSLFDASLVTAVDASDLPSGDVRRIAQAIQQAPAAQQPEIAELARRWATGERLRVGDRRKLDVHSNVEDASTALDALAGLVRLQVLADGVGKVRRPGLLLFLDEFEVVFTARRDRRDLFFVVLRELIDACGEGGLFLCVGMTTGQVEVRRLEIEYPALYARLKGSRELPQLSQVKDTLDARGYVHAFIEHGQRAFVATRSGRKLKTPAALLGDDEIRDVFESIGQGRPIAQGDFFDGVRRAADDKVARPTKP
ncbi:MAG: DUF2791 family P-loop domain-containing protein [Deltaproteobacteria bacterium]|nr:DUF2791 family P-loop domain-containing protein [Deltaproteobacteria bacterium]